jgi:hypothetical protein
MRNLLIFSFCIFVFSSPAVLAQDGVEIPNHFFELTYSGQDNAYQKIQDIHVTKGQVEYHGFQIGMETDSQFIQTDGSEWTKSSKGYLTYSFDMDYLKTIVGLNVGYLKGNAIKKTYIGGTQIGFELPIVPSTFLYGSSEYNIIYQNSEIINKEIDKDMYKYSLGMVFQW